MTPGKISFIVHIGNCYVTNKTDNKRMGYYFVKLLSDTVTLHEDNTKYWQVFKLGELDIKVSYIKIMKANMDWYWEPENNPHIVIFKRVQYYIPV